MSPDQTRLYFREWGKVRRHFLARGIDPNQADAKRYELHTRALGVDKSSKDFSNTDLDKVLGVFFAILRPDDLNSQLRQLDQGEERKNKLIGDCHRATYRMADLGESRLQLYPQQTAYIFGIARNVIHKPLESCSAEDWAVIHGVLLRRVEQLGRKREAAQKQPPGALKSTAAEAADSEPNPF